MIRDQAIFVYCEKIPDSSFDLSRNKGITDTKLPQSNIPVEGGDAVFSLDDELEENEQPKPQA